MEDVAHLRHHPQQQQERLHQPPFRSPGSPLRPSPDRQGEGAPRGGHGARTLRSTKAGGSQKERAGTSMLESHQSAPSPPSMGIPEDRKILRGGSLPSEAVLPSPIDRRLDRQKAQVWGVDQDDQVDDLVLTDESTSAPGIVYFRISDGSPRITQEVDADHLAFHLELLQELPEILAKTKGEDISDLREAAVELRELSGSTAAVVAQLVAQGGVEPLMELLHHEDTAVVETAVLSVASLAKHRDVAQRLADCGIMAALSTVVVRAGEASPRPHTSIQGNVAAAYLALFSTLHTTRAPVMLTGARILRSLLLATGPLSGSNYQGRRDALRLLLVLSERPDVRTQLAGLGAADVLVQTVESGDGEILEEVAALLLLVAKSVEGVRQLCSSSLGDASRTDLAEGPEQSQNQKLSPRSTGRKEGGGGARGVAALVRLLDTSNSSPTQEYAASTLMRILTRGLSDCSQAVRSEPSVRPALETLLQCGSSKAKRMAEGILDALSASH